MSERERPVAVRKLLAYTSQQCGTDSRTQCGSQTNTRTRRCRSSLWRRRRRRRMRNRIGDNTHKCRVIDVVVHARAAPFRPYRPTTHEHAYLYVIYSTCLRDLVRCTYVCEFASTHVVHSVFGGAFVMTAAGWGAPFATQNPRRSVTK